VLLAIAVSVLAVGGFVLGAYLAGDLHQPLQVVLGAIVAIGLANFSNYVRKQAPWRRVALRRIQYYSNPPTRPDGTAWALLPDEALPAAWTVLSKAHLWTGNSGARLASSPEDAPGLCNRVFIVKSDATRREGDLGAAESAAAALAEAGIRARVNNIDVP
jgi:hypothetical protein